MSEYQDHLGALKDMHRNIQRKRYALDLLDSEYTKLCLKIESDTKCVEELTKKIYTLDSYLTATECRLAEYDRKEKDWENEVNCLKKSIDKLKTSFEEEGHQAEADDTLFDERIMRLIEDRRKDREIYDRNTSREQTDTLQEIINGIHQETIDITKAMREMKATFPFVPRAEVQHILENTKISAILKHEIGRVKQIKSKQLAKVNSLKENISSLENEIRQLCKQL